MAKAMRTLAPTHTTNDLAEAFGLSYQHTLKVCHQFGITPLRRQPRRVFPVAKMGLVIARVFHEPTVADEVIAAELKCAGSFCAQVRGWMAENNIRKVA